MKKLLLVLVTSLFGTLASTGAHACAQHMYLDTSKMGFLGGAVARMAGLAPPEPVFKLAHPPLANAIIGEKAEIEIEYKRPFFSKDVKLLVKGSSNVRLTDTQMELNEREGVVVVGYELTGQGFDSITFTVSGEHKGEAISEQSRMYLRARAAVKPGPTPAAGESLQVSGR